MEASVRFVQSEVPVSDGQTMAFAVVSLKAPPAPKTDTSRPPLCIVPVVDLSGSMDGQPLHYVKQSLLALIDHLAPGDYTGLVTFSSEARTVVPMGRVTAEFKTAFRKTVQGLRAGGNTNFAGGFLQACSSIANLDLPLSVTPRVVMFTDGQANTGLATSPQDLCKLLSKNRGLATVSAFGYGGVSQEFLTAFAQEGQGNYAFIDKPDTALSAFGAELGALMTTYATQIEVRIRGVYGHHLDTVVSEVETRESRLGDETTLLVPALLCEEERHLVVAFKLDSQNKALPRPVNVLQATIAYQTILNEQVTTVEMEPIFGKVRFTKGTAGSVDSDLQKQVDLALLAKAQNEAEQAAQKGNYQHAQQVLQTLSANVQTEAVAAVATNMSHLYQSSVAYTSTGGRRQGVRNRLTRGMSVASYDSSASDDLTQLGVSLNNSSQLGMQNHFSQYQGNTPVEPPAHQTGVDPQFGQPVDQNMYPLQGGGGTLTPAVAWQISRTDGTQVSLDSWGNLTHASGGVSLSLDASVVNNAASINGLFVGPPAAITSTPSVPTPAPAKNQRRRGQPSNSGVGNNQRKPRRLSAGLQKLQGVAHTGSMPAIDLALWPTLDLMDLETQIRMAINPWHLSALDFEGVRRVRIADDQGHIVVDVSYPDARLALLNAYGQWQQEHGTLPTTPTSARWRVPTNAVVLRGVSVLRDQDDPPDLNPDEIQGIFARHFKEIR